MPQLAAAAGFRFRVCTFAKDCGVGKINSWVGKTKGRDSDFRWPHQVVKSSPSPDKKVLLIINHLVTSVSRKRIPKGDRKQVNTHN